MSVGAGGVEGGRGSAMVQEVGFGEEALEGEVFAEVGGFGNGFGGVGG